MPKRSRPLGEMVEQRDLLGHPQRIVPRQDDGRGADIGVPSPPARYDSSCVLSGQNE